MSPLERQRLLVAELQAALTALRRARLLSPDDAEIRGALILIKRALFYLDCPSAREDD